MVLDQNKMGEQRILKPFEKKIDVNCLKYKRTLKAIDRENHGSGKYLTTSIGL